MKNITAMCAPTVCSNTEKNRHRLRAQIRMRLRRRVNTRRLAPTKTLDAAHARRGVKRTDENAEIRFSTVSIDTRPEFIRNLTRRTTR
jgi:hypothetical protein